MNKLPNTKIFNDIVSKYKRDKNVLGVMLFGSVARNRFDRYSDIDIYILLEGKGVCSRVNFIKDNIRVDIILDTIKEARLYLKNDMHAVRRNTSHMIAHGRILYKRGGKLPKLQVIAQKNLLLKTKCSTKEVLMHKYSIDDFWGEVQRDLKNDDGIAFSLDSQLLLNNIIELFLKLNGEFFRQPNEMSGLFKKLDKNLFTNLKKFCLATSLSQKKDVLSNLVRYSYKISGGELPTKWKIK